MNKRAILNNTGIVLSLIMIISILLYGVFVTATVDTVDINSPEDTFYTNNQTPEFSITATGSNETANCTLYIDEVDYGYDDAVSNDTPTVLTPNSTLSDGTYSWYVNCTDIDAVLTQSAIRTITIDTIAPYIDSGNISDPYLYESDAGETYIFLMLWSEPMNITVSPTVALDPDIESLGVMSGCSFAWINSTESNFSCLIVDNNYTVYNVSINVSGAVDLAGNVMDYFNGTLAVFEIDMAAPVVSNVWVSDSSITAADVPGPFYVFIDYDSVMNDTTTPTVVFSPSLTSSLTSCTSAWLNTTSAIYNCTIVDANESFDEVNITITLAEDLAGNVQTSNTSVAVFVIDTVTDIVAPNVTLLSPDNNTLSNVVAGTFELNFTASDNGASLSCDLFFDDSYNQTNSSVSIDTETTFIVNDVSEGIHPWSVNCTDNYTIVSSETWYITVDNTAPTAGGSLGPSTILENNFGDIFLWTSNWDEDMNESLLPTFSFSPDLVDLGVLIDCNTTWANSTTAIFNCTINTTYVTILDVNISITGAMDLAGNVMNSFGLTDMIDIDTAAPVLSVESPVDSQSYNISDVDFNFTVSGQDSCWYSLDVAANVTLSGCDNITLLNLSEDVHSLILYANDSVGNIANLSISFTVADSTAPYIDSGAISDMYIYDSNAGETYSNIMSWSEPMNIAISPNIVLDPDIESLGIFSSCTFDWLNTTVSNYSCLIVDTNASVADVSINVSDAEDLAGNVMDYFYSYAVVEIDTAEPLLSIDSPLDSQSYNVTDVDFNFTVSGQDSCWYSLDVAANVTLSGCDNITLLNLSEDVHSLILYANDSVGNIANLSISFTVIGEVINDTDGPSLNITAPLTYAALGPNSLPYLITGTAFDAVSGLNTSSLDLYVDGVYNDTITNISGNNWNYLWNPVDGTYNISILACDVMNNCNDSLSHLGIVVDLTPAVTTPVSVPTEWNNTFNITLASIDEKSIVSYIYYNISTLSWQNMSGDTANIILTTATNISSGNITIYYYSVDSLGNPETVKNFTLLFDKTGPVTSIIGRMQNGSTYTFNVWSNETALINLTATDADSGTVDTIQYCTDTINLCTPNTTWSETFNVTTTGITYVRYRSNDTLGNVESTNVKRVMILNSTQQQYLNTTTNASANQTVIIIPTNNSVGSIIVPRDVTATLDLAEILNLTSSNATISGAINTTVNTTIIITLDLPENLTLSGNSSWLGVFNLPKLVSTSLVSVTPDSGKTASANIVVEVGADDIQLLLDKAVRINLSGESAKYLGYYRNGFVKIATECSEDNQAWADSNLTSSETGHCRISNGTDLIIWTKHLSKFVTYDQDDIVVTTVRRSSGGGGGGVAGLVSSTSLSFSYQTLVAGTRTMKLSSTGIPLSELAVTTNVPNYNVRFTITKTTTPSATYSGRVYNYVQIDHNVPNSTIDSVRILFKVSKSWLTNNSISSENIMFLRYVDGWTATTVKELSDDSSYVYYEATSPGMSLFAIAAEGAPVVVVNPTPVDAPIAPIPVTGDVVEEQNTGAGVNDVKTVSNVSNNIGTSPITRFTIATLSLIALVTALYLLYKKRSTEM